MYVAERENVRARQKQIKEDLDKSAKHIGGKLRKEASLVEVVVDYTSIAA